MSSATKRAGGIPRGLYDAVLFLAAIIWGASFFMAKDVVEVVGPTVLVGLRFTVAAILMLVFFFRRIRAGWNAGAVRAGLLLGLLYFLAFWAQTVGLTDTTPGKNAFLTATYVVMVPFAYWMVARRKPTLFNIASAVLCLVGIGLVSLSGDVMTMRFGDAMTLVCAVFYAFHIALLGKFAQGMDVYLLAFLQFAACGALGLLFGVPTEGLPDAHVFFQPDIFGQYLFLAVGSSFLACLMQNVGQAHVPPNQAVLILCLESVFGVLFSVVFYGEVLTLRIFIGFVVIFVAIVASEVMGSKEFT